jgi:hypothetical protein
MNLIVCVANMSVRSVQQGNWQGVAVLHHTRVIGAFRQHRMAQFASPGLQGDCVFRPVCPFPAPL